MATIEVCVFSALTSLAHFFIFWGIMEIFRVAFIGHREVEDWRTVDSKIDNLVRGLIRIKEYVEFYVGYNGDFDISVVSIIKRAQNELGNENSSLILVLPYKNKGEKYFVKYYDEIYMPVEKVYYKATITKCNQWMIDNCNILVAYVNKDFGGAYNTLRYAEKKGTPIINLANEI